MINGWKIHNGSLTDLLIEISSNDDAVPVSCDISHTGFAETVTIDVEAIPTLQNVLTLIMQRVNEAKS